MEFSMNSIIYYALIYQLISQNDNISAENLGFMVFRICYGFLVANLEETGR